MYPLFLVIIALVIVLDQLTKILVVESFLLYESREVIPGFFNLTYLTNNGAAFSMLAGSETVWRQAFFICAALTALIILVWAHHRFGRESRWYTVGMGLIAGGAIGNLIDRIRLGSVVDFLDVYLGRHHWPAFNVADSAICVGVVVFIVTNLVHERKKKQQQQVMQ